MPASMRWVSMTYPTTKPTTSACATPASITAFEPGASAS